MMRMADKDSKRYGPYKAQRILCGLAALLYVGALAAEDSPAPDDHAAPYLGCWKSESEDLHILFEASRCRMLAGGQLRFMRVKYLPGKIHFLGQSPVEAMVEGDSLVLKGGGEEDRFKKANVAPEGMDLKPWPLGDKHPGMARMRNVQTELAERQKEDQAVRTDPARRGDMQRVDEGNTKWLKEIVAEFGWIDPDRFGAEASNTAFLIVQHSGDLALMASALPKIEAHVKEKKLDPQNYALLYDRFRLYTGHKQRYGTQIGQNAEGLPAVLPLEDRANVEKLRAEIGLFPLAQYLKMFEQMSGGKEIQFIEE